MTPPSLTPRSLTGLAMLPPVEQRLQCRGQTHRLTWADGVLATPDHADPDGERTLAALGAAGPRCIQILDAWQRHNDDLDVLLLASRGPTDPITAGGNPGTPGPNRMTASVSPGPRAARAYPRPAAPGVASRVQQASATSSFGSVSARHAVVSGPVGSANRAASGSGGWGVYSPFNSPGGPIGAGPDDELSMLLTLDGALTQRLVATVAASWVERIDNADARVPAALAALCAALYGRAAAALHAWLANPDLDIQLQLGKPGATPTITRDRLNEQDTLHLTLPFSWLVTVWAPGLATIAGHFSLAASHVAPGRTIVSTVGPALGPPRTITLEIEPPPGSAEPGPQKARPTSQTTSSPASTEPETSTPQSPSKPTGAQPPLPAAIANEPDGHFHS